MTCLKLANRTQDWCLDYDDEPDVSESQQVTRNRDFLDPRRLLLETDGTRP